MCVQHLLETTGSLIQTLVSLGLNPSNVYILGKAYSSNSSVEERFRRLGTHVVAAGRQQRWGEYSTQLTKTYRDCGIRLLKGLRLKGRRQSSYLTTEGSASRECRRCGTCPSLASSRP